MEYDNTNTGAVFQPNGEELSGTGTLNDKGNENRIAVVKASSKDGSTVRDIYLKIGRMWENDSQNGMAPQFTGQIDLPSDNSRVAAWVKQGSYGTMLSLKLSPKLEQEQSSVDNDLESDDIPF
jgi:hypothetical protein|tara:strand:+ start:578 stop:946 length:369 start_codon:yes stop_codon:yes gene_type:complete